MLPTSPASPAAPFPRLSRSPRFFSRLAATCRRLRALCTLSPGLRGPLCCGDRVPTPMMAGTLSSTLTASPRLLVAPRPPSPSRPTPLELVGVLATSVAVASAKPPSAPCGGKFDVLSPVLCAFSAGVASLAVGFVLDTSTLLRVMGKCWWTWSFPAVPAQDVGFFWRCWRWPWRGGQLGNCEDAEKPNKSYYDPRKWLREVEFIMVAILTGEGSSQVQDLLLLGRHSFVNGFGDCRWCHDEAHRTQHHHSHEEGKRSRRTLTTSRVFSSRNVHCGAASITAM